MLDDVFNIFIHVLKYCVLKIMQSAEEASTSTIRVSLFNTPSYNPPRALCPILPAEPVSSVPGKQRVLPPGIAPTEKKPPPKSVEILLNSGLQNPVLVNLKLLFMLNLSKSCVLLSYTNCSKF